MIDWGEGHVPAVKRGAFGVLRLIASGHAATGDQDRDVRPGGLRSRASLLLEVSSDMSGSPPQRLESLRQCCAEAVRLALDLLDQGASLEGLIGIFCEDEEGLEVSVVRWADIVEELPAVASLAQRYRRRLADGFLQCFGVTWQGLYILSVPVLPEETADA